MSATCDVEDRVNMIPMIDTMLFLILFFMMVIKFTPAEKIIASLLPTDKGQPGTPSVLPSEQIFIAIYPAGMQRGFQPSHYSDQLDTMIAAETFNKAVFVRVGGAEPIEIRGDTLDGSGAALKAQVDEIHAYIDRELSIRETNVPLRKDQPPVTIACFTGLSWKYSLLAYDAVRAHEIRAAKLHVIPTTVALAQAREVNFAPPRVGSNQHKLADELYEIIHLR